MPSASRTSQSARSVAVEKPLAAAARIRAVSEGHAFDHPRHRRDAQAEQIVRLEHRRLVVLHVLRIGERQPLHRHHQRWSMQPMIRPAWPRTSSAASGLRFCGMIELPVDQASGSLTKPKGCEAQMMISSASRDRCSAVCRRQADIRAQNRGRTRRPGCSRSACVEAERARVACRSIGKPVPASAADPSGSWFIRARASAKRLRSRFAFHNRPSDDGPASPAGRPANG
jgi:hypothetical protein